MSATRRAVDVFVSPHGNQFMADIASWVAEAARETGRRAQVVVDRLPERGETINFVVAPHEYFTLAEAPAAEIRRAAAAAVPICTEQPGTPWFNLAAGLVQDAPLILDINPHGVAAFRARDIEVDHLQLGGVPSMVAEERDRDLAVLFLGGSTPYRRRVLAGLAPILWDRSVDLKLFRFSSPVHGGFPGVVFGKQKYEVLARAGVLLNIHRDGGSEGYFEWARMVEAMANGCAVLTQPSTGHEPLEDGRHFVASDDLRPTLEGLLDDESECRRVGEAARDLVMGELALRRSLEPILDRLDDGPLYSPPRRRIGLRPQVRHAPPVVTEFRPAREVRRRLYDALAEEQRLLRAIGELRAQIVHDANSIVERFETPSYASAEVDVSVIVTLYNYAGVVVETLDSICGSQGVTYEIVVVDDDSRDESRSIVLATMESRPETPMLLLASNVNRGLPAARNAAVAAARADRIMVMDADNLVYPNCLAELSAALDADPSAAFSYCTLEAFGSDPGLRSELPWHPRWLCESNYIDAQAMIRRSTFERHGSYRENDLLVYGWEDWELWLRLASAGERGVHVPRMLGRYRTQPQSMIGMSNLAADDMRAHLRELHPDLPWP